MSGWRLARSLDLLRDEIRAHRPGTTVWTIGDQAHASGPSDHNPTASGVVCAIDVLGDKGLDLDDFARRVVAARHPAFKYLIYNRRIWSAAYPGWRTYTGSNPHSTHVHISVGVGPDGRSTGPYDDLTPWALWEDDMPLTDDDIQRIAQRVNGWIHPNPGGLALHTLARHAADGAGQAVAGFGVVLAELRQLAGKDWVDEDAIVSGVLAGLGGRPPEEAAAALVAALGEERASALAAALAAVLPGAE